MKLLLLFPLSRYQRIRPLVLGLLLLTGGIFSAAAQEQNGAAEPPTGALLKSAPDFSKWTVTFEYPKEQNPKSPPRSKSETIQMTITKTGNLVWEDVVDRNGCHEETWHVGDLQYRKPAGKSEWFESSRPSVGNIVSSDFSPMPVNGFRGWDWVGRDSFVGTLESGNGASLVFVFGGGQKLDLSKPGLTKEQIAAQPLVAFVNPETRLPVALRSGDVTQRFLFAPPPSVMLVLPPDLMDQIKKAQEARQRLYQPAPRPF